MPIALENVEPMKLATWLQVTLAQRQRAQKQAATLYGADSAAAAELTGDVAALNSAIAACVQAQANAPKRR